jgi:hypothetical protein
MRIHGSRPLFLLPVKPQRLENTRIFFEFMFTLFFRILKSQKLSAPYTHPTPAENKKEVAKIS